MSDLYPAFSSGAEGGIHSTPCSHFSVEQPQCNVVWSEKAPMAKDGPSLFGAIPIS